MAIIFPEFLRMTSTIALCTVHRNVLRKLTLKYRPGQPNWEYTMRKFQDISAIQILREIDFDYFQGPKTAILII